MRRLRVFNDSLCRAVVYPVGVVRAPGGWSSVRRQQQRQQLNQADAEEVALNAAPHLSGVAAPRRPAPLPGERRALVGLSRQEGETGGGPEVESHAWTRVLLSNRGLYFFIPEWTPSSFGERPARWSNRRKLPFLGVKGTRAQPARRT